jgi:7-cyano-7-deazaguanine synthase
MRDKKALVLLSGGQDSTTCLYWSLEIFGEVKAIGFNYGQSHEREITQAQKIAERVGVSFKIFDSRGLLAKSSLTEHADHDQSSHIDPSLPASFTAGRNILFLAIAASYAAEHGINDIITGVCQTDYSGYPDCRRTTIDAMQNTLSLGIGSGDFRIHTPLMYLNKAETWKMAKELNCLDVIIRDTVTDYNGDETLNEWGRGLIDNPASKLRAKGYYEAKKNGWL